MADESTARITRVKLKNYKSIVSCDVELRPLTILVGPNGSGKGNFVDALRFVKQALVLGLDQAIRNRGNVEHILSKARPSGATSFAIELGFRLGSGSTGTYAFEINATLEGGSDVVREQLVLDDWPQGVSLFSVNPDGTLTITWNIPGDSSNEKVRRHSLGDVPNWAPDRLMLATYSGTPEGPLSHDLLASMAFYNPTPSEMVVPREREEGLRLVSDAGNVASVLRRIEATKPETFWRINQYLSRVLPGLVSVAGRDLGGYDSIEFRQRLAGRDDPRTFTPRQMSYGTLRALGVLVALFQGRMGGKSALSLVAIEEPEAGLHPAVGGALLNALIDASESTQVLVTTHGTDLLDNDDVDVESLLAVVAEDGVTQIGPLDEVGRSLLRDRLYTAGELLHFDQLRPAVDESESSPESEVGNPSPVSR